MNFKTGMGLMVASGVIIAACTTATKRGVSSDYTGEARNLTDSDVVSASSTRGLKLTSGRLIIDNDASFESKLRIIKAAKTNLYLTYYIYSDDYTSSVFNAALIEKASSGVKVHIMVDLATNYAKMDLFRFLEAAGKGNIEVRFYNKPSAGIQRDAYYLTLPCSHENQVASKREACEAEKRKIVEAGKFTPQQQLMQKLYLSSYYTKNGPGLQVATVGGQQIDVENAQKVATADKAKQDDFKKGAKKAKEAKAGSISSALSLQNLISQLANEIDPSINLVTGFLPLNSMQKENKDDWDHISDYTHQKLIVADVGEGRYMFQLGGRNIEDSYHLKTEFLKALKGNEKQKYLFRDTDFFGEVASGGEEIVAAYLRNWNFSEIVATTKEMDAVAPFDLSVGVAACGNPQDPKAQQCIQQFFMSLATPQGMADVQQKAQARAMEVGKNTQIRAQKYMTTYAVPSQQKKNLISFRGENKSDELSANDLNSALITYIENLNTRKDSSVKRTFGAFTGNETATGKYMSHLWQRGMENACASGKETSVILHSAYLLPSSSMVKTIGKMVDGTWNCGKVQLKIITNSFETTDLNIINIFARGQMQAIFNKYLDSYTPGRSAQLSYFEYTVPNGQTQSLHTKLSLLGDDMIDGSANADVRSYYMDSNNGVYLRNVKDLAADYREYINELQRNGTIVEKSSMFATYAAGAWTKKDHKVDVDAMTKHFIDYWISRTKNPDALRKKYAGVLKIFEEILKDKAQDAFESADVMLTPSKFSPESRLVDKQCGKQKYGDNENYGYDTSIDQCVEKMKKEGVMAVDPAFNLSFEAF